LIRKEKTMKQPYLIQQAKFSDRSDRKGIDSILAFDYMGSAEFEFGALPQSLKRIRENIDNYIYTDYPISKKKIRVFCNKDESIDVVAALERLSKKEIKLKEWIDFSDWLSGNKHWNDFWWDIDNDFMFWKKDKKFESKFKQLIKGE